MDFNFSKEQLNLEEKCQQFAKKEIAGFVSLLEEDTEYRQTLFQKMAREGLFSLCTPKEYGGGGADTISYALALKAIAYEDAGISVTMAVTNMVAESIYVFGTEEQRRFYLPKIQTGECIPFSFALTEKNAGSDAKSIQSKAVWNSKQQEYILEGEKQFITNGDLAGAIIVMAKTEPTSSSEGMTAFLVSRGTPGLRVTKKERKLGLLTANLVDLRFDNCCLAKSQVLGEVGAGFKIAMRSLDSGRIGIAAQAIGIAEAAHQAAIFYAKNRRQFGRPIADHQAIAFKLADMQVKLDASKLMLFKACWLKDSGMPFQMEASEAKLFSSEAGNEIVNEALQIYGGYGYVKDYPMEKYFRDMRVTTLYEGTSEIQRLIISRMILK